MQVGVGEFAVLVVAGVESRARELAAAVEDGGGGSAVTATDVEQARERLNDHAFDAVVLEVPETEPAGAVEALADDTGERPLVAVLDGELDAETALSAGATDVVERGAGAAVLTNRLALALAAARAERTAREARQRYHELLDASPAAIIIYDESGELLYANDAAADLVGAEDPHDVVGRRLFEFVDDDYEGAVREQFERLVEENQRIGCEELALVDLDGERRFVESAASPVTVAGDPGGQAVLTDITALKERERRLRTQRDRFTALFESLPEPAVHVRYEDDEPIVRNVNTAFEETFGYDVDEIRDENLDEYIVPDEEDAEPVQIDTEGDDPLRVDRDLRRQTADGVREFRFSARSVHDADGTQEGVGIYVDVTERKRHEQELERQNERLDAFASIVSHDLQGPLSIAKGNLYLARDEGDLDEKEAEYVQKVDHALDRMERIIQDLLRLARTGEESIEPEPLNADEVVTEAWQAVELEGGDLVNDLEVAVNADRSHLVELLSNLLRNAVEHGGEDVTVTVGELEDADGRDRTGFYVADDGPGISEDERDEVFEPGYTTHDEGTGFGLVVVEEIARAHGWEPSVTESEDGGARFEFRDVERA